MRVIFCVLLIFILFLDGCFIDPNSHEPSDHPCNFPDRSTENNLRTPFNFKILHWETFENVVDTTEDALIHPDSVRLFTSDWEEIDPEPRFNYENEWIFDNFIPYINVPFHDPQVLLDLDEKTFYLKTSHDDIDTIQVIFTQCLVEKVYFNGVNSDQPKSIPSSAGFYFKKKF